MHIWDFFAGYLTRSNKKAGEDPAEYAYL